MRKSLPKIIAHRGASGSAPENTLPAIKLAKKMGAHAIEIDVCLTKDKQPVVAHDNDLTRIFQKNGCISEITYAELKTYDAGVIFSKDFQGCQVPHLKEVLALCNKLDLMIDVELKPVGKNERFLAEIVVDVISEYWDKKNLLYVTSISKEALCIMHDISPDIPLGLIIDFPQNDLDKFFTSINCQMLVVNANNLTERYLAEFKRLTDYIYAYTVNTKEEAEKLFSIGVTGVFTDHLSEFYAK